MSLHKNTKITTTTYPTEMLYFSHFKGSPEPPEFPRELAQSDGKPCAICGRTDQAEGYKTYTKSRKFGLLSENFGEHYTLAAPWSAFSCKYCESAIRNSVRLWSGAVITDEVTHVMVGREAVSQMPNAFAISELRGHLLSPPDGAFIISFNKNLMGKNGTHYIHQSVINMHKDQYFVNEADKVYLVDREFLSEVHRRTMQAEAEGQKPSIPMVQSYLFMTMKGIKLEGDKKYKKLLAVVAPYLDGDFVRKFLEGDNLYTADLYARSYYSEKKDSKNNEDKNGDSDE